MSSSAKTALGESPLLNFAAVIQRFAPLALTMQLQESESFDRRALAAIRDRTAHGRSDQIRTWLESYRVFMGITDRDRTTIANAVLEWADSRDEGRRLTTVDDICAAHHELEAKIQEVFAERKFTSLSSKALWLCYPEHVPIFDRLVQSTLFVLSKLDMDIAPSARKDSEYRQFAHVWKALYDKYSAEMERVNLGDYKYRIRIFDKILWILGEPRFGLRAP